VVGLRDVARERWPGERVFSHWHDRAGMFCQDLGMRIDIPGESAELGCDACRYPCCTLVGGGRSRAGSVASRAVSQP
jgi:hypothetical protein